MTKYEAYQAVLTPMRAAFTPPPQVSKSDENAALEEYADALKAFDLLELREAWTSVRDANKRGFWPAIGLLVDAARTSRKARREREPRAETLNGRVVDGKYQPWGGACRCRRCVEKTQGDGFYRATSEEHSAAQQERADMKSSRDYRLEMLPPIDPGESVERWRARLAARFAERKMAAE